MPATRVPRHRNTLRVVTYNILLGGARRHELICDVLTRIDADVIALQEVCDLAFLRSLGKHLEMEVLPGPPSEPGTSCHVAILSRRPVRAWRNRQHRDRMLRSHLHCEIETGSRTTPLIGVHCVHLAARFGERAKGEARRMRELTAVLEGVTREGGPPHMLIGDFNALAPGDGVAATRFFKRMHELRRAGLVVPRENGYVGPVQREKGEKGEDSNLDAAWRAAGIDPRLDGGVPLLPRAVWPLTARLPAHPGVDRFLGRFIERWTIERLLALGYVDCFRRVHPRALGRTCATWLPAARVDYVFANPDLAPHLVTCDVVGGNRWPDHDAAVASDHFPLVADFSF
jgi:endonuclease/exonuclease/phosphatase family metal-dependent hydrolase